MDYFNYKKNTLYAENVDLNVLAKKFKTPLYVYSKRTMAEHFNKINNAFSEMEKIICYSVKANSNIAILNEMRKLGSGFDIVSGGELYRALKIGADPSKIVYAGVGKTKEEIDYAIRSNILMFNVESINELKLINLEAKKFKKKVKVALRINPDVDALTHNYVTTGKKENKFGIDIVLAFNIFKSAKKMKNIDIKGIHMHIGSQITSVIPYIDAIKKISNLITDLKNQEIFIDYLNIGGGLGIIYNEENPATADEFAYAIKPYILNLNLKLILEPGRFIVGNAGILLTKVIYNKKGIKKNFLIVDAGMNDLIRPSLYGAYHKIIPVNLNKGKEVLYDVVGPICESGDFLGKDRHLPEVKEGDLLAIRSAGAYGFSMSSNYNSRLRAAEVLVDDDKYYLIREREKYEDLISYEKIVK